MPEHAEALLLPACGWSAWAMRLVRSGCSRRLQAGRKPRPANGNGLAQRDKRAGNWERAVLLWQKAAACMEQALAPTWEAHAELGYVP